MRLVPFVPLLLAALPAQAFEFVKAYQIRGDELVSWSVTDGADGDEAPMTLSIALMTDSMGPLTIEIESDLGFGTCTDVLAAAQGDPAALVMVVQDMNADTMNGVRLEACARQ